MKMILIATLVGMCASSVMADTYVRGYVRKDGTYVQPHHRSDADSSQYNNYSSRGNINPYTGQTGTVSPSPSYGSGYPSSGSSYGQPQNHGYGSYGQPRSNGYGNSGSSYGCNPTYSRCD